MTFEIHKASDWHFKEHSEVNTFEDLMNIAKKYARKEKGETYADLIIEFGGETGTARPLIIIYDGYVE